MKYINHTPWKLCLAPHNSIITQIIEAGPVIDRGYVNEEIVDTESFLPVHELFYSVDLPPPQADIVHIVSLKAKLCRQLRDRNDVVAIGSGNQKALIDAIEIWNFIR
jgi:hypothetical protein